MEKTLFRDMDVGIRHGLVKLQKRKTNSKVFRSFSPQRKPAPPLFPNPVHHQGSIKSNTNLLNSGPSKTIENHSVISLDKMTVEQLLMNYRNNDNIQVSLRDSKKKIIHKRKAQSFYKKFDTHEVLAIYGVEPKKKVVSDVPQHSKFMKDRSDKNIDKYLEMLKEKSKVLMEKIQKSYKTN